MKIKRKNELNDRISYNMNLPDTKIIQKKVKSKTKRGSSYFVKKP